MPQSINMTRLSPSAPARKTLQFPADPLARMEIDSDIRVYRKFGGDDSHRGHDRL
jgi:hypothetical protein